MRIKRLKLTGHRAPSIDRVTIWPRNQAVPATRSSGRQLSREPLGACSPMFATVQESSCRVRMTFLRLDSRRQTSIQRASEILAVIRQVHCPAGAPLVSVRRGGTFPSGGDFGLWTLLSLSSAPNPSRPRPAAARNSLALRPRFAALPRSPLRGPFPRWFLPPDSRRGGTTPRKMTSSRDAPAFLVAKQAVESPRRSSR